MTAARAATDGPLLLAIESSCDETGIALIEDGRLIRSNVAARRLYEKYGFRPVGIRPRYYSDNGEDALIMTTEPLDEPPMRQRLARLRAALEASGVPEAEGGAATDVPPAIEPEGAP